MDKCGVAVDDSLRNNPLYDPVSYLKQSNALNTLIALYVGRCHSLWKAPEVISWLVNASKEVIDQKEVLVKEIKEAKFL